MPTRKELIASGAEVTPLTREEYFLKGEDVAPLNVKERVLQGVVGGGIEPEGTITITQIGTISDLIRRFHGTCIVGYQAFSAPESGTKNKRLVPVEKTVSYNSVTGASMLLPISNGGIKGLFYVKTDDPNGSNLAVNLPSGATETATFTVYGAGMGDDGKYLWVVFVESSSDTIQQIDLSMSGAK